MISTKCFIFIAFLSYAPGDICKTCEMETRTDLPGKLQHQYDLTTLSDNTTVQRPVGLHVCSYKQVFMKPHTALQPYHKSIRQDHYLPCREDATKICSEKRTVYTLAYRSVKRWILQTQTFQACCPGWTKKHASSSGCETVLEPKAKENVSTERHKETFQKVELMKMKLHLNQSIGILTPYADNPGKRRKRSEGNGSHTPEKRINSLSEQMLIVQEGLAEYEEKNFKLQNPENSQNDQDCLQGKKTTRYV